MAQIIGIVGRPGSGKSTLVRAIKQKYGEERNIASINDYSILYNMFEEEQKCVNVKQPQFRARQLAGARGFDVIDRQVFPAALRRLKEHASRYLHESRLVLLEFARNDYTDVRKSFGPDMFDSMHFIFLKASLETCIQRIQQRVEKPRYKDDKLVSPETMRRNHEKDGLASLCAICEKQRVSVINNEDTWDDAWVDVKGFLDEILPQVIVPGRLSMANLRLAGPSFVKQPWVPLPI